MFLYRCVCHLNSVRCTYLCILIIQPAKKPEALMQVDTSFKHQISVQLLNTNTVCRPVSRAGINYLGIIIQCAQLEWTVQILIGACSALHMLLIMLIRFHSLPYLIIVLREGDMDAKKRKKKCNWEILTYTRIVLDVYETLLICFEMIHSSYPP